jgi:inositol 1,4,5-triphosphate receptor type 1
LRNNLLVRYFAKPASLRSKKAELSGGSGITTTGTHLNLSGGTVGGSGTVGQSMLTTQGPGGLDVSYRELK